VVVATVRIRPAIRSWEKGPDGYEELAKALSERDVDVELQPPPPPPPTGLPLAAGMDFGIDLLGHMGHDTLIAIEAIVVEEIARKVVRAARRRGQETPVMGVIYGPDRKILKEVSWNPQQAEEDGGGGDP
jgi:hypothetical protein